LLAWIQTSCLVDFQSIYRIEIGPNLIQDQKVIDESDRTPEKQIIYQKAFDKEL
jgi:hypothetical protein